MILVTAITTTYGEVDQDYHAMVLGSERTLCDRAVARSYDMNFATISSAQCPKCIGVMAERNAG